MAAVLVAAACSSAPETAGAHAPKASDIRALRWVHPNADKVSFLTSQPVECKRPHAPTDEVHVIGGVSDLERLEIGRLAFESPALLGGAAGRMGLSCASCHRNGRGNDAFFIESVSDGPGTADVTSSIFSKVRGDGTFNPVPIPDLAAKDGKQIVDRKSDEFRTKVHGLVVEEFDGQETPSQIFSALLFYLDKLDISACENPSRRSPLLAADDIRDASTALAEASRLAGFKHIEDAQFMARAARDRLGMLHERFVAADQGEMREALVAASRAIEIWSASLQGRQLAPLPLEELKRVSDLAGKHAERSLYNPDALRAALAP